VSPIASACGSIGATLAFTLLAADASRAWVSLGAPGIGWVYTGAGIDELKLEIESSASDEVFSGIRVDLGGFRS
jgi:hypothetical protein